MFAISHRGTWGSAQRLVARSISLLVILTVLLSAISPGVAHAIITTTIMYASPGGLTSGACDTWGNACELSYALDSAVSGDEIWVEQGTYTPGALRTDSFVLKNGVGLLGGFAGTETDASQRNVTAHATYLSGEIGDPGLTIDNSYHVVTGSGTDNSAGLNGFIIRYGNANSSTPTDYPGHEGGGMYNLGGSPTVAYVLFESNEASEGGGGMWNSNYSSPYLSAVEFLDNSAPAGGAMYNTGYSDPTLTDVSFDNNTATGGYGGGAMLNDGGAAPHLTYVTFSFNNASTGRGGAMANQDGAYPAIENTTFFTNSAGSYGGAIYNTFAAPSFTNVSFNSNSALTAGDAVYNDEAASVTIQDTILWGDGAVEVVNASTGVSSIDDSVIQGGCPASGSTCNNLHTGDPLLSSPDFNGGATKSMAIGPTSSALDTGNDSTCATDDQRYVTRSGQGPHCDIGSFEHIYGPHLYVSQSGPASGWCDTWGGACNLSWALGLAVSGQQVWVKSGAPYFPTSSADRTISFELKNGVELYGGFMGTETLLSQRDFKANLTYLDGNIGSLLSETDNSYHVVKAIAVDNTAVLDGFLVGGGYADGSATNSDGGVIYTTGSPTLRNLVIGGSYAASFGGGLYNDAGSPQLTNVTFIQNTAGLGGGGMYNNTGSPALTNATFTDNHAGSYGGAMESDYSEVALRNTTFSGNTAGTGGGALDNLDSVLVIRNTILWGDGATSGPELYNQSSTVGIDHSVVEGSGGSGGGWDTGLGTDGGGNLDADPKLSSVSITTPIGPPWVMLLLPGSSGIDAGDDGTCDAHDALGISRPRGLHCDIGASEHVPLAARIDFDRDARAEIGYFDPTNGLWALLQSNASYSYGSPQYFSWGQTGDLVVPGDYDGDGKADPTIRRPPGGGQSAAYLVLQSSNGYNYGGTLTIPAGWPGLGDTPVPADYNGDGITDPAIWRANTGAWIIPLSPSFTQYKYTSWGVNGDYPVGADVDGDGMADIGYFRPSTGTWGFLLSTQRYSFSTPQYFSWGSSTDKPAMGDYDGDGKADPAFVTPPANGQSAAYRILLSSTGYDFGQAVTLSAGWPGLGDTPVPQDYDGDGKTDAAIWRSSTGVWIIPLSSTNNVSYIFAAWGASGDQPVK